MTTFIALSILIGGKGAIKVKDNFPVLAQSNRQSGRRRGEANTWTGGRFRQALLSSGQKLLWLWKNLSVANVSKCHGDSPQELWQGWMRERRCAVASVTRSHLVFLADVPPQWPQKES